MCDFMVVVFFFFFFKQKTAYEMRISDWSSDVCSSDLPDLRAFETVPLLTPASSAPFVIETVAMLYSPVSNRERIPVSIGYRATQRATTTRAYSIFPRHPLPKSTSLHAEPLLGAHAACRLALAHIDPTTANQRVPGHSR